MHKKLDETIEIPETMLELEKERIIASLKANEEVIESYEKSIAVHELALEKIEGIFELEGMADTFDNIIEKHKLEKTHYEKWNEKAKTYLTLLENAKEEELILIKAFMNLS